MKRAEIGAAVLFASKDRKSYVRTLQANGALGTHLGTIAFNDVIGLAYGSAVRTHLDQLFYLLQPSLDDLLQHARHTTTIIQPKDLGYIALKLGVASGSRVIEAGTGSGGLTTCLALLVGDSGQVISYDRKADSIEVARRNLDRASVTGRVQFKTRDVIEGFDETDADALFLDVPNPWDFLAVARAALIGGGHFGAIVPTMNQVIDLVSALYQGDWFKVEVEELLLRSYKVLPARVRPDERMVGHTGYLIFARAVMRSISTEADESDVLADEPEI